jgi:hypothetical protein
MSRRIINIGGSFLDLDPDALAFITNWEANTSVTMQQQQRDAVIELYAGLKGQNTVNGTDFWTDAVSREAVIYPLVPLTDTTANALSYELDMVSNGVFKGTYNGFVAGDFTQNGVIGGTGKYFDMGKPSNLYGTTTNSFGFYTTSNLAQNSNAIGESGASNINGNTLNCRNGVNQFTYRLNNDTRVTISNSNSQGLFYVYNINTTKRAIINNTVLNSTTQSNLGQNNLNKYSHCANDDGTPNLFTTRRLCMYYDGVVIPDNDNAREDWYELWQRFQTNVIDGGRQV